MDHRLVYFLRRGDPRAVRTDEHRTSIGLAMPRPRNVVRLALAPFVFDRFESPVFSEPLSRLCGEVDRSQTGFA